MKHIIRFFTFLIICLITNTAIAGGPWLLPKNSGFVQASTSLPAHRYSNLLMGYLNKDLQGTNRYMFNSDFGIYAEYGLTDKFDIMMQVPLKYVDAGNLTDSLYNPNLLESGSLFGMSNYRMAIKYGLLDKKLKAAISVQTGWNTISKDLDKGLTTGFDANSFGLRAHVGGSINPKWYAYFETGYTVYTNNFSDVLEGVVEAGYKAGKSLTLIFNLDFRQSMENGSFYNDNLAQTGFYPNDQEWVVAGVKVLYETPSKLGFNFGTGLVPIQFRYVGFNGAINLGVYKRW